MRIVGIAGSLRQKSFNKSLLGAAMDLAPAGMTIDAHSIEGIPLFNEDIEADVPDVVTKLKTAIASIVMPQPQVFVGSARERFDADGTLSDEKTRAFLAKYLA